MRSSTSAVLGDVGALVRFHGKLYWKEYRYDRRFEAYVAEGLAGMVLNYDSARDRLWVVKEKDRIIGSIAIVHHSRDSAQLRWFLVAPAFRRKGLGKRLARAALRFARSAGYRIVFLWTTSELDAARHVYESAGFRRTAHKTHDVWGRRNITEERYDLCLGKAAGRLRPGAPPGRRPPPRRRHRPPPRNTGSSA